MISNYFLSLEVFDFLKLILMKFEIWNQSQ